MKTPPAPVEPVVSMFSSIVERWRRQRHHNPRCRNHNRMMIHSWRYRSYSHRRGSRRNIASPEEKCRCGQYKKYSCLFHGFISVSKQIGSRCPRGEKNSSQVGSLFACLVWARRSAGIGIGALRFLLLHFHFDRIYLYRF